MGDNVRIKLVFSQKLNKFLRIKANRCWSSVNNKIKIEDFINLIIEKFFNFKINALVLSLDDCVFPLWESCDILRDNDIIYVDTDSQYIPNYEANLTSNYVKSNEKKQSGESDNFVKKKVDNNEMDNIYDKDINKSMKYKKQYADVASHNIDNNLEKVFNKPNKPTNLSKTLHVYSNKTDGSKNDYLPLSNLNNYTIEESDINTKSKRHRRKRHKIINNDNDSHADDAINVSNSKIKLPDNQFFKIPNKKAKYNKKIDEDYIPLNKNIETLNSSIKLNGNLYSGKHLVFSDDDDSGEDNYDNQHLNYSNDSQLNENSYSKFNNDKKGKSHKNVVTFKNNDIYETIENSFEKKPTNDINNLIHLSDRNDKFLLDPNDLRDLETVNSECHNINEKSIANNNSNFHSPKIINYNQEQQISCKKNNSNKNFKYKNMNKKSNYSFTSSFETFKVFKRENKQDNSLDNLNEHFDDISGNKSNIETTAEPNKIKTKNVKIKSYLEYPIINEVPYVGSLIAFKLLEMGANYCPNISEYKEGKVVEYIADIKEIKLEIILINKSNGEVSSKFEVRVEDEESVLTNDNRMSENQLVSLCWTSLIEPRLIIEPDH